MESQLQGCRSSCKKSSFLRCLQDLSITLPNISKARLTLDIKELAKISKETKDLIDDFWGTIDFDYKKYNEGVYQALRGNWPDRTLSQVQVAELIQRRDAQLTEWKNSMDGDEDEKLHHRQAHALEQLGGMLCAEGLHYAPKNGFDRWMVLASRMMVARKNGKMQPIDCKWADLTAWYLKLWDIQLKNCGAMKEDIDVFVQKWFDEWSDHGE